MFKLLCRTSTLWLTYDLDLSLSSQQGYRQSAVLLLLFCSPSLWDHSKAVKHFIYFLESIINYIRNHAITDYYSKKILPASWHLINKEKSTTDLFSLKSFGNYTSPYFLYILYSSTCSHHMLGHLRQMLLKILFKRFSSKTTNSKVIRVVVFVIPECSRQCLKVNKCDRS